MATISWYEACKRRPVDRMRGNQNTKAMDDDMEFESGDEGNSRDHSEYYGARLSDEALSKKTDDAFDTLTSRLVHVKAKSYINLVDKKAIEDAASEGRGMVHKVLHRLKVARESNELSMRKRRTQNDTIRRLLDENRALKAKVFELDKGQKPTEAATALADKTSHELELAKNDADQKAKELRRLKSNASRRDREIVELKKEVEAGAAETANAEAGQRFNYRQAKSLTKDVTNRDRELRDLKTRLEQRDEEVSAMKTNTMQKEQLPAEIMKTLEGGWTEKVVQAALDVKIGTGLSIRDKMAHLEEEIKELKDTINRKNAGIQLMEGYAGQKDQSIADLRKARRDQTAEAAETKALMATKDSEIRVLKETATSKTKELAELKNAMKAQAAQTADTKALREAKDKEIHMLKENMTSTNKQLQELKQTTAQKTAETEMLWDRLVYLQGESKKRMQID